LPRFFSAGKLNSSNTEVNISGGLVGDYLYADGASRINITGGSVGNYLFAGAGSQVNISGGAIGSELYALSGSHVNVVGGEFRLNGVPVEGLTTVGDIIELEVPADSLLSGVLSDGTPFVFSTQSPTAEGLYAPRERVLSRVTLESGALPSIGPATIVASQDIVPQGIRSGQTLLVDEGAFVVVPFAEAFGELLFGNFTADIGSTIIVEEGGILDGNLYAVGAEVSIAGYGFERLFAFGGTDVMVSGEQAYVGNLYVFADSQALISDGCTRRCRRPYRRGAHWACFGPRNRTRGR
jgi:hypothetical protein